MDRHFEAVLVHVNQILSDSTPVALLQISITKKIYYQATAEVLYQQ